MFACLVSPSSGISHSSQRIFVTWTLTPRTDHPRDGSQRRGQGVRSVPTPSSGLTDAKLPTRDVKRSVDPAGQRKLDEDLWTAVPYDTPERDRLLAAGANPNYCRVRTPRLPAPALCAPSRAHRMDGRCCLRRRPRSPSSGCSAPRPTRTERWAYARARADPCGRRARNSQDDKGDTALHAAVRPPYPGVLPVLVRGGVDINRVNHVRSTEASHRAQWGAQAGQTALVLASELQYYDTVDLLIELRADPTIRNQVSWPVLLLRLSSCAEVRAGGQNRSRHPVLREDVQGQPRRPAARIQPCVRSSSKSGRGSALRRTTTRTKRSRDMHSKPSPFLGRPCPVRLLRPWDSTARRSRSSVEPRPVTSHDWYPWVLSCTMSWPIVVGNIRLCCHRSHPRTSAAARAAARQPLDAIGTRNGSRTPCHARRTLTGFQKEGRAAFEIAGRVRTHARRTVAHMPPAQMAGEALANMKTVVSNSAQDHIIKRFSDMCGPRWQSPRPLTPRRGRMGPPLNLGLKTALSAGWAKQWASVSSSSAVSPLRPAAHRSLSREGPVRWPQTRYASMWAPSFSRTTTSPSSTSGRAAPPRCHAQNTIVAADHHNVLQRGRLCYECARPRHSLLSANCTADRRSPGVGQAIQLAPDTTKTACASATRTRVRLWGC
jgi:hypothetical protein